MQEVSSCHHGKTLFFTDSLPDVATNSKIIAIAVAQGNEPGYRFIRLRVDERA